MATMLPLVEVYNYDLVDVMLITIPASIVGIFAMSIVMSRHGKDLEDDVEYQRRLAAGEMHAARPAAEITLMPFAKRSVAIFLAGGRRDLPLRLRRGHPADGRRRGRRRRADVGDAADPDVHAHRRGVDPHLRAGQCGDDPGTPIFKSGMVAMIALFGIAWMADTFIANNEDAIVRARQPRRELAVHDRPRDLPRRRADDEPVGGDPDDGPARARARDRRRLHDRDVDSRRRRALLPANGTQIAAAEADKTGTTTLGKRVVDHSFQLPLQICWIVTALVGCVIV